MIHMIYTYKQWKQMYSSATKSHQTPFLTIKTPRRADKLLQSFNWQFVTRTHTNRRQPLTSPHLWPQVSRSSSVPVQPGPEARGRTAVHPAVPRGCRGTTWPRPLGGSE